MSAHDKKPDALNWKVSWDVLQWVNDTCRALTKSQRRKVGQQEFAEMVKTLYESEKSETDGIFATGARSFVAGGSTEHHRMLDEILGSGIPRYVTGIEASLEWGARAVQESKGQVVEGTANTSTPDAREPSVERALGLAKRATAGSRAIKSGDQTPKKGSDRPATGT